MKQREKDSLRTNATSMTDDKLLIFAIRVGMKLNAFVVASF